MGDMLSQAEIDALLSGASFTGLNTPADGDGLNPQEIDALGEIGNISMGTSATTLFTLLGHKVTITTPTVTITDWDKMAEDYNSPLVAVKVEYTHGLVGMNLLIMKERDVKVITDLMMGGEGREMDGELSDLHLSAISEAMNQMVGSAATSMSTMFDKRIDISPPKAFVMEFNSGMNEFGFEPGQKIAKISFKMIIGDLIDSEIMQLIPMAFAKTLVENLLNMDTEPAYTPPAAPEAAKPKAQPQAQPFPQQPAQTYQPMQQPMQDMNYPPQQVYPPQQGFPQGYGTGYGAYGQPVPEPPRQRGPVNVQPAHFQSFDDSKILLDKNNINLIMDVPLQVTVELGRTHKMIKDILEFGPGSIIELDKLAGEPVDIMVNGKAIAKGEVVVIDESFGVRITDIIHPSKRL